MQSPDKLPNVPLDVIQRSTSGALEEAPTPVEMTSSLVGAANQSYAPQGPPSLLRFNKKALFITGGAITIVLVAGLVMLGMAGFKSNNQASSASQQPAANYNVKSVGTANLNQDQLLSVSRASKLSINGELQVGNTFVLTPTATPSSPKVGQIYYNKDTNTPYVYNGSTFVSLLDSPVVRSIAGVIGDLTLGNGLQLTGTQLSLSSTIQQSLGARVTTLQGQSGDVLLRAGTGVTINGTTITNTGVTQVGTDGSLTVVQSGGTVSLSLPQLIGTTNSPTFAGLQLSNALGMAYGGTGLSTGSITPNSVMITNANGTSYELVPATTGGECLITDSLDNNKIKFGSCTGTTSNGVNGITDGNGVTVDTDVIIRPAIGSPLTVTGNSSTNTLSIGLQVRSGYGLSVDGSAPYGIGLQTCTNGQVLKANGSGWSCDSDNDTVTTPDGGVTSVGALNGQTKNANGAVINGTSIYLQTADATSPGLVSITGQTLTGVKTFSDQSVFSAGIAIGVGQVVSGVGALTVSAANNANLTLDTSGTGKLYLSGYDCSASGGGGKLTVAAGGQVVCGADGDTDTTGITQITAGDGISISGATNIISATIQSGAGLQVSASGLGLLNTCTSTQILKYNGTSWACESDNVGTGDGVGITAVGSLDGGTVSANGAYTDGTNLFLQSASALNAGLLNTGAQTFAGAKTFGAAGTALVVTNDATIGGTVTTGGIVGSGALSISAGGTNQNLTLSKSGTGNIVLNGFSCAGNANGGALTTDGSGNISCSDDNVGTGDGVGITAIGAFDSGTANANGASTDGTSLFLQSASATNPGLVNTGVQSFAGTKTFTGAVTVQGNLTQSGAGAFSTGSGAVSLNGDVTIASTKTLTLGAACAAGQVLTTNLSGVVSCAADQVGAGDGVGMTAIGALDGGTANANAAYTNGTSLFLQSASATNPGVVNTGVQSFAGAKAFTAAVTFGAASTALSVTNNATISGTLTIGGVTGSGALTVAAGGSNVLTLQGGGGTGGVLIKQPTLTNASSSSYTLPSSALNGELCIKYSDDSSNCTGLGGAVSSAGGTPGTIAVFTGTNTLGDSILLQDASGTGALTVDAETIWGNGALSIMAGKLGGAQDLTLRSGGSGTVDIDSSYDGNILLGYTNGQNRGIYIGNDNGAGQVNIEAGSGGIKIGQAGVGAPIRIGDINNVATQTINIGGNGANNGQNTLLTLGSSHTNSTTTIQGGNGIALTGNVTIGSAKSLTLGTGCTAGQVLTASVGGLISCAADATGVGDGGVTAVGTIDSQTKSSDGAVISGSTIYLQTADASNAGLVSTGTQSFAGDKTFTGATNTFNSGATTQTGLQVNTNSLTTGSGLKVSTTSSAITSGSLLEVSQNSAYSSTFTSSNKLLNVSRSITGQPAITAPILDATTTAQQNGVSSSSISWSHTVTSASSRVLIVDVMRIYAGNATSVIFTVGGVPQAFTQYASGTAGGTFGYTRWILVSPASGTGTIQVNMPGSYSYNFARASSWQGVDLGNPFGATVANTYTSGPGSLTTSASSSQTVVDAFMGTDVSLVSQNGSQTLLGSHVNSGAAYLGSSYRVGAASMGWTWGNAGGQVVALMATPLNGAVTLGQTDGTLTGPAANIASSCLGCTEASSVLNLQQANTFATGAVLSLQNSGLGADIQLSSGILRNAADSTAALSIQNSAGTETLFKADTTNNRVVIGNATGTGANTTTLVLDAAATDPTGVIGAMYYNTANNVFMCYTTGWFSCSGTGASVASGAGTSGKLVKFNGSGQLADSGLSESSTTLTYAGNAVVNAASGFSGNLLDLKLNGTSRLTVNQAGNTSIAGTLTVAGNTIIQGSSGAVGVSSYSLSVQNNTTASWIEILNSGGAGKGAFFGMSSNNFEQWNYQGGDILFYTGAVASTGTERLRITSAGAVVMPGSLTYGSASAGLLVANTSGVVSKLTGTSGQCLLGQGASAAPIFTTCPAGSSGWSLTGNDAAGSVLGSNANTTANFVISSRPNNGSATGTGASYISFSGNATSNPNRIVISGNSNSNSPQGGGAWSSSNTKDYFRIQDSSGETAFAVQGSGTGQQVFMYLAAGSSVGVQGRVCSTLAAGGSGMATIATCTNTGTDLAEAFNSTQALEPGEIVAVDHNNYPNVVRSSQANQSDVIGIVSTDPNDTMGTQSFPDGYPVALNGRVPTKVNGEGGAIQPGDKIMSSSVPGVGKKATGAGMIVGVALTGFDGNGQGTIQVFVSPGYYEPTASDTLQAQTASFDDLNVSGTATINNLTVTGLASVHNLSISGHIITASGQPTSEVQAAAGTGAAITINGNDTTGTVTITTGVTPAGGDMAKLVFSELYGQAPHVVLSPSDSNAADIDYFKGVTTADGFVLTFKSAPQPNTTYTFDYFIAQ